MVTVAMVQLVNAGLGLLPHGGCGAADTAAHRSGWAFRPLLWLIGIPWREPGAAATLMGTKTVLNEFVAYLNFAELAGRTRSARARG